MFRDNSTHVDIDPDPNFIQNTGEHFMPKIILKELDLFGIKLDSKTLITPRTKAFFDAKAVTITQDIANETVIFDTGDEKPSFTDEEVQAFLRSKT